MTLPILLFFGILFLLVCILRVAHIGVLVAFLFAGINSAITGDLLTTAGCSTENDFSMFKEAGYDISLNTDW